MTCKRADQDVEKWHSGDLVWWNWMRCCVTLMLLLARKIWSGEVVVSRWLSKAVPCVEGG